MSGGGKGGGGGGGSSQKSEPEPWDGARDYITEVLGQAKNNYAAGYGTQIYPGQPWIDPSRDTLTAQAGIRDRATAGSPLLDSMDSQLTGTINGQYLDAGNPHLGAVTNRVADEAMQRVGGMYGSTGRVGGSGYDEAMARGIGDAVAPYAFQNYENERGRQQQGMMFAPSAELAGYMPAQQLGLLGKDVEGYEQQRLGADMARFNQAENAPWSLLGQYSSMVGPYSGFGQASTGSSSSGSGDALSSIAQTAALASMIFMPSSRAIKHIGDEVDGESVLEAIGGLEIGNWQYRADAVPADQAPHVGPYAEDFAAAFGLGDGKTISIIDAFGVLFAAVKTLSAKVEQLSGAN